MLYSQAMGSADQPVHAQPDQDLQCPFIGSMDVENQRRP